MKQTKIICTIGPSSSSLEVLSKMIKNGMNVARLNFSHGDYKSHAILIKNIRLASAKLKTPIAIMQDLQGPKIRIGELVKPVLVKKGQTIVFGKNDIPLDFDISGSVKPKERLLIEDGLIEVAVTKVVKKSATKPAKITCKVVSGGEIRSHKGVNLPDSTIRFPIFTKKDKEDLKFGLEHDVDFIALSFVRSELDVLKVKEQMHTLAPKKLKQLPLIIAKIERSEALTNIEGIIEQADAVMVARGDLGVEIPDSQVPLIQKELIAHANALGKPVIVATQLLDSMIRNPRPTRAEVSDVANAVIDHADAVMLSGETAFGQYPIEAVAEMSRIIEATEASPYDEQTPSQPYIGTSLEDYKASLIAGAVEQLALGVEAEAIIGTSESGYTARFISRERPDSPVIILTDRPKVYRQMCLVWGITPLYVKSLSAFKTVEHLLNYFVSEVKRLKLIRKGEKVVLVAGNPLGQRMNLVQAVTVK